MAMDYCEESLQVIDITPFLKTLCGHIKDLGESGEPLKCGGNPTSSKRPATFVIGEVEEDQPDVKPAMASLSRYEEAVINL